MHVKVESTIQDSFSYQISPCNINEILRVTLATNLNYLVDCNIYDTNCSIFLENYVLFTQMD